MTIKEGGIPNWKIQDQILAAMRYELRTSVKTNGRKKTRAKAQFYIESLIASGNIERAKKYKLACRDVLRGEWS